MSLITIIYKNTFNDSEFLLQNNIRDFLQNTEEKVTFKFFSQNNTTIFFKLIKLQLKSMDIYNKKINQLK